MQRPDVLLHLVDHGRVHGGRRLVEQDQLGVGHERGREGEELALAVGEAARRRGGPRRQPHRVEQLARPLDRGGLEPPHPRRAHQPGRAALLLVLLQEHEQVLERGEAREHADELEGTAHAEPRDAVRGRAR